MCRTQIVHTMSHQSFDATCRAYKSWQHAQHIILSCPSTYVEVDPPSMSEVGPTRDCFATFQDQLIPAPPWTSSLEGPFIGTSSLYFELDPCSLYSVSQFSRAPYFGLRRWCTWWFIFLQGCSLIPYYLALPSQEVYLHSPSISQESSFSGLYPASFLFHEGVSISFISCILLCALMKRTPS